MLEPVRRMHLPALAATSACLIALALGPVDGYAREASQVLEEVVVSSRKLGDERLQDVPQSILAISSKQIQNFAIGSFEDYARLVPSQCLQLKRGFETYKRSKRIITSRFPITDLRAQRPARHYSLVKRDVPSDSLQAVELTDDESEDGMVRAREVKHR